MKSRLYKDNFRHISFVIHTTLISVEKTAKKFWDEFSHNESGVLWHAEITMSKIYF